MQKHTKRNILIFISIICGFCFVALAIVAIADDKVDSGEAHAYCDGEWGGKRGEEDQVQRCITGRMNHRHSALTIYKEHPHVTSALLVAFIGIISTVILGDGFEKAPKSKIAVATAVDREEAEQWSTRGE